jgi:hypothetical protein
LKDREPSKPFQKKGTNIHKALEIYLKTGEVLPTVEETTTLEFVQAAIPFIPKPRTDPYWTQFPPDDKGEPTAMLLIEEEGALGDKFTWDGGPQIIQYIDNVRALPTTCKIQDYKTTSDFRNAKTPEELQKNTQLCWNAKYIFTNSDYDEIEIEHLYLLTKGRPKAMPVSTKVTRAQVEEVWQRDLALIREMVAWGEMSPITADPLPPNTNACDDYGGCYYRTKCGFDVANVGWKKRIDPMSETQKSSLLSQLLTTALGAKPDSPLVQQTKAAMEKGPADLMAVLGGAKAAAPAVPAPAPTPTSVAAAAAPAPKPETPVTIFEAPAANLFNGSSNAAEALKAKLAARPAGIVPPDAPPATSTPEEVEAATAAKKGEEEAAAAEAAPADAAPVSEPGKKRGRPKKVTPDAEPPVVEETRAVDQVATLATGQVKHVSSATPVEVKAEPPKDDGPVDSIENLRKILETPDNAFACGVQVLYIDTLPFKGIKPEDQPIDLAERMHAFEKVAAQSAGKSDYRLIEYTSKAYLANAVRVLMAGLPKSMFVDSRIPGADVFLSVVTPYCTHIFRGIR